MPKITKSLVETIRPGSARRYIWDAELRGFGILVYASGRASYIVQYRNREGRSRRLTLGQVGGLTPNEARKQARQHLAAADRGEDPLGEREAERNAPTIAALAERYMREHALPKKKPSSVQRDESVLRVIIIPALGERRVAEITRADVAHLHHRLHKTPVRANRTIGLLSKMMNLAERWGLRPDHSNPCRHIDKHRERPRERYLSTEELGRLGQTLDEAGRDGSVPANVLLVLRLLLFTGCRRGEIQKLRWDEVDLGRGILHLATRRPARRSSSSHARPSIFSPRARGRGSAPPSTPPAPRRPPPAAGSGRGRGSQPPSRPTRSPVRPLSARRARKADMK